ncbi:hypothetical protein [Bacillus toyonensis]|uniref:hypothetical protein n=1 Tax=Bacillus toyonensis TaxID=155322 RepID=UPI000BF3C744|nr:hypothetical protein [Bacillus toyonensis]PGC88566.1 hypothetical protein COM39_17115 [Bacillus toyonensis]
MDNLATIIEVLKEIRISATAINSELTLRDTMDKYNMLFMGDKLSKITSPELRQYIIDNYQFTISEEAFLKIIPIACKTLGMKTEALAAVNNPSKISAYFIQLF